MVKINVTEKDFEAFLRAVVTLQNISKTLDDYFYEEASEISEQFKSFQRRYLKAKEKQLWHGLRQIILENGYSTTSLICEADDCIEHNYWLPQDRHEAYGFQLPKGSIKKLIGRELSCTDKPIELK